MEENKIKWECGDCGVYYIVDKNDRNTFNCPNCEDRIINGEIK